MTTTGSTKRTGLRTAFFVFVARFVVRVRVRRGDVLFFFFKKKVATTQAVHAVYAATCHDFWRGGLANANASIMPLLPHNDSSLPHFLSFQSAACSPCGIVLCRRSRACDGFHLKCFKGFFFQGWLWLNACEKEFFFSFSFLLHSPEGGAGLGSMTGQ